MNEGDSKGNEMSSVSSDNPVTGRNQAFDDWYNEIESFAIKGERLQTSVAELRAAFEAGQANQQSSDAMDVLALLPPHKGSLCLEHNPNRDVYQTVGEWIREGHDAATYRWRDDNSLARAVETEELWVLQWYPDTPVGFHLLASHSLVGLLGWVREYSG